MKNIIFSRRNLDFNFVNLELFSAISELPGSFRTRLHIGTAPKQGLDAELAIWSGTMRYLGIVTFNSTTILFGFYIYFQSRPSHRNSSVKILNQLNPEKYPLLAGMCLNIPFWGFQKWILRTGVSRAAGIETYMTPRQSIWTVGGTQIAEDQDTIRETKNKNKLISSTQCVQILSFEYVTSFEIF